jgi:hypothetical protein
MDRKQMVVLTRSSKNKKYRETDYDIENIEVRVYHFGDGKLMSLNMNLRNEN